MLDSDNPKEHNFTASLTLIIKNLPFLISGCQSLNALLNTSVASSGHTQFLLFENACRILYGHLHSQHLFQNSVSTLLTSLAETFTML
jgi:hypothetical protein